MYTANIHALGSSMIKKVKYAIVPAAGAGLVASSQLGVHAQSIDFSNVTEIINSVTTIFPALGNLIMACVPLLIEIAIVGLVLGIFGAIVAFIHNGMKIF
jgi:hypothetical protein